ncbi:type 4a pilus biogenesis protein PilO [Catenovulum maritimum]|uniref:Pilus assembly protein PilP n=1 Tax=Catenovulum maritimum TaxID=1513271 RepID=A0A0J8JMW2_9ALTE|nr:type 4a pilus biogenesis protein PilO [Catenovulum maritimum]KMT65951.1 pilus assembly protein PilP [Catenovulum maritimum]
MDWKNIDLADLKELELDFNNMGAWPNIVKIFFAVVVAVITAILAYNLMVSDNIKKYQDVTDQEAQLKFQFQTKYQIALNADAYKSQMEEMEKNFAELLKRLPTASETPGLLDDITYVGTTSGLSFNKINWEAEIEREFYTELPLRLEVVGGYHEFGEFLSRVAALPRIVTLHDFTIDNTGNDVLILKLLAKTYRYKEVVAK